ncbi:REP-associated tyrosine transposase [Pseudomonas profundi]|uniref:REP-associated tyrosine transposase n=1 Tax=Pseudomonas profundi TaxID=1981513 RepID=UPI001238ADDA|nr:transposase [Pseudomonas profundi]
MNNLKRHASDLRKGRTSEPGRFYLVTAVTLNREPVFANLASARTLINTLRSELSRNQIQTWAYVVMPDHFHWLMQLNHEALSEVVGRVKGLTAKQLGRSIWQSGFHDRAVRKEDDLKAMARYIIANPLRAGLVESVADYSHWDAVWL